MEDRPRSVFVAVRTYRHTLFFTREANGPPEVDSVQHDARRIKIIGIWG